MKKILLVVLTVLSVSAFAGIRLPAVISSHMVLQQKTQASLWGWAGPNEKIFITTSWNNVTDSVIASRDAKWEIKIPTPAAGGPYTITLKGANTIVLEDVMIGEVWICSGQSNMEWSSYNNLQQIIDELPNSNNPAVRLFHIAKTTAATPQDDCPGTWKVSSPESLKGFSAIGYFFAKKLQQQLNVPVGVINASWGGTPAEVWTPAEVINNDALLKDAATKVGRTPWWAVDPGLAYNAMISPVTSFSIAGALWYQGESNTNTYSSYQQLFTEMIKSWRKAWKIDFPFYYVQIAPFYYGNKHVGSLLQEQQTKTLQLQGTGMVVITDLVDNVKDIHPKDKLSVADRLANMALAETYQKKIAAFKSPQFTRMVITKGKAHLFFTDAPNGFIIKGDNKAKATEFYIAGVDEKFLPAEVKVEKDRVVLFNKLIKDPVAVRFAFSNTAMANLFSKEIRPDGSVVSGLPVTPFRTDTWEVNTEKIDQ